MARTVVGVSHPFYLRILELDAEASLRRDDLRTAVEASEWARVASLAVEIHGLEAQAEILGRIEIDPLADVGH